MFEMLCTVLWAVLKEKRTGTMERLVGNGADINSVQASIHVWACSPYEWKKHLPVGLISRYKTYTPLALAAFKGLTKAVEWLLKNGADPEIPSRGLCSCRNTLEWYDTVWSPGDRYWLHPVAHWTPLHLAVERRHEDVVNLLLEHGANTQQICRREDGPCSILHTAFDCEQHPSSQTNAILRAFECPSGHHFRLRAL